MPSMSAVLTVSESKRLIAKAIPSLPCVQDALQNGTVAICKGSTNAYIVEEILSTSITKAHYLTGNVQPARPLRPLPAERIPDVVLERGSIREGVAVMAAIGEMGLGDVIIKGANAVNTERTLAGVLVGDPHGGTVGATIGRIYGSRVTRVIPVGLEKTVSGDILSAAARALAAPDIRGYVPTLWPVQGLIVTEIEALELLCGVQVTQLASGGINGAEGAVWLLIEGDDDSVAEAEKTIGAIHGEPPFADA